MIKLRVVSTGIDRRLKQPYVGIEFFVGEGDFRLGQTLQVLEEPGRSVKIVNTKGWSRNYDMGAYRTMGIIELVPFPLEELQGRWLTGESEPRELTAEDQESLRQLLKKARELSLA